MPRTASPALTRACAVGVLGAVVPFGSGGAQPVEVGLAAGVAVPAGAYGDTRTPGPVVRGSLTFGARERRVRLRTDVEGAWLLGQLDRAPAGSSRGTLRALGVVGSVLVSAGGAGPAPYASAGVAVQRLAAAGSRNPYGATFGVRAGAGVRWRTGRHAMHAEVTPHLALTDYATGRDFVAGAYVPVTVGFAF
jgi:hypothetical protein